MNKGITEDYVSYEIAVLLKEKGFDGEVSRWYVVNFPNEGVVTKGFGTDNDYISAPTHQMTLKWLREVHNIHVEIRYMLSQFTDEPTYKAMIWNMDTEIGRPLSPDISYTYFETCCEAAIKYTLENLI